MTPRLPSWPTLLQAFALVLSPRLGLRHVVSLVSSSLLMARPRTKNVTVMH
jgi:hypothetical protein